ncbi:hypothetical protein [Caballeronia sp. HLA56]
MDRGATSVNAARQTSLRNRCGSSDADLERHPSEECTEAYGATPEAIRNDFPCTTRDLNLYDRYYHRRSANQRHTAADHVAGWHHDFNGKQAAILNRLVMLYALPLSLFTGMVGTSRDHVLAQGPLALALLAGMADGYIVVFVIARYIVRQDVMTSSL